jgi:alanine dehydrogenase
VSSAVVGVVREVKAAERRVGLTPAGAVALADRGHRVLVEAGAGAGAGFPDDAYSAAGARLVADATEVWGTSDLLVKVKEPIASEYGCLRPGLALFTYLHLAADRALTEALLASGTTAIGYETVQADDGRLPLLAPMSEVAGRLAAQAGAHYLQAPFGGPGLLIGGAPGVAPARVAILGGGVVGTQAARVATGMGADVTILDTAPDRLRWLEDRFERSARVLMSDADTLHAALAGADLVIGAVLVPGAAAPRLLDRDGLAELKPGAVLVDVAIDQGGCFATSRPTTHGDPTYAVDGVLHYCVANMPGAVPVTSTRALTNATLPWVLRLAAGVEDALATEPMLARGLNAHAGRLTCEPVARAFPDLAVAA